MLVRLAGRPQRGPGDDSAGWLAHPCGRGMGVPKPNAVVTGTRAPVEGTSALSASKLGCEKPECFNNINAGLVFGK